MAKKVDANGYWYIKHNPVSKEGVFPYLGHTISEDCEPNKIYKVYRPAKTLKESVDSWDNPPKPFIDDHEMLGEGFTAIDERPVQGIIYNPVCEDGVLYCDIAVYSEDLKHNIENGKKELSLGYFCKYRKQRGVFKGEVYDYVQEDMVGNHIALVDAGRCGSDVKVFDRKCTMDSMSLDGTFEEQSSGLKKTSENDKIELTEQKDSAMNYVSIEAVRTALTEAFTYGDGEVDPKVKLIIDLLESKAKPATVADEDDTDEDEKKAKDSDEEEEKETKDSEKDDEKSEDKCGKDSDESEKGEEKENKKAEDALQSLMAVVKDMADDIKKLVAEKETKDEDEEKKTEDADEDEEKETEDEDGDEEEKEDGKKTSEDSAVFVFGNSATISQDEALRDYLK